jgi:thiol-disulfide isomerase/thioredoxin
MVKAIESYDEFKTLVSESPFGARTSTDPQINGDEPVVVDFWATWCGPCKMISPHFAKMEEKYPGVKLVKVDVEEQEVSSRLLQRMVESKLTIASKSLRSRESRLCLLSSLTRRERRLRLLLELSPPRSP